MTTEHRSRRRGLIAASLAMVCAAAITSCSAAAPPPVSPAHVAGVALQEADNYFRSGFQEVVAMNATNAGALPCSDGCWPLTHLEQDDYGNIPNAYETATQAYSTGAERAPKEIAKWKSAITAVQADITAWGNSADLTGGNVTHSASAKAKTLADLDKADALINAFAPPSVRALPATTAG